MLRLFVLFSAVAALAAPAFAASDDDLRKAIVGTWGNTPACDGQMLVFNADGTFTEEDKTDPSGAENGTYQISNGHLTGKSGDTTMPDVVLAYDGTSIAFQNDDGSKNALNPCPPLPAAPAAPAPAAPAQ